MKYRALIGLALVYLAVFFEYDWIWGILFLIWVIPDIPAGETHFMEVVNKKQHPILYWAIVISWLWMSIFMISTPFWPSVDTTWSRSNQVVKLVGNYKDKPIRTVQEKQLPQFSHIQEDASPKVSQVSTRDTLGYKIMTQKDTAFFIGVSVELNSYDKKLAAQIQELWDYFLTNDITPAIPNIVDERVYFIYSDNDKDGNFKATLGVKTSDVKYIYEGLTGIVVAPQNYAVFESPTPAPADFVTKTWEEIYNSTMDVTTNFNMEVYELDPKGEIVKAEVRLAQKAK